MRRLGVLINSVYSPYTVSLLKGVERFCTNNKYTYYLFPLAHGNNSGKYDYHYETLLNFINATNIDGLVILPTTFAYSKDYPEIIQLINRLPDIPKVSLGLELEGIPFIKIDCDQAIIELCEHLIEQHNIKNPILMRCSKGNFESDHREELVLKIFSEHGIQIEEKRILDGRFVTDASYAALSAYIRANGNDFDAVVCLNDKMALSVYKCLIDYDFKVPEEVVITGFDGDVETAPSEMNVTTINPRVGRFAFAACEYLCAIMDGKKDFVPKIHEVKPDYRGSCGCGTKNDAELIEHFHQRGETIRSMDKQFYTLHHVLMSIQKPLSLNDLFLRMFSNLSHCDVRQFVLVLYDEPIPYKKTMEFRHPNTAKLVMSFFDEENFLRPDIVFNPNKNMFPPQIEKVLSGGYTIVPLFAEELQYGYMLFKMGNNENIFYQIIFDLVEKEVVSSIRFSSTQTENVSLKNRNISLEQHIKKMNTAQAAQSQMEQQAKKKDSKKKGFWPFSRKES